MIRLDLGGSWDMYREDGPRFHAAVPGTVLSTLLANGAIPDPFDGMNETAACAETEHTWHFERSFTVTAEQLREPRADLAAEGIDTLIALTASNDEAQRFYKSVPDSSMHDIGIWIDIK